MYQSYQNVFAYVSVNSLKAVVMSHVYSCLWGLAYCLSWEVVRWWPAINSDRERGKQCRHHQACLLQCSGISVANHPTGLALPHLKCWGACSQKPWVPITEYVPGESEGITTTTTTNALPFSQRKANIELWNCGALTLEKSELIPASTSLLCLGSTGLGAGVCGWWDIILWAWRLSNRSNSF